MTIFLYILIGFFGLSSYIVGVSQILKNKYSPNVFSRVVWLLLAVNAFVAILMSGGSKSSILLGGIFLVGNFAICILSFWKGIRSFGRLEYICLTLLLMSVLIWIFFDAPLLNLVLSLFAYFIGALPTYKRVWKDPKSESFGFWSLFFVASLLSVVVADFSSLTSIIFPIYFTIFDGIMALLAVRKVNDRV